MQAAIDKYGAWTTKAGGVQFVLSKDHSFLMYHDNIEEFFRASQEISLHFNQGGFAVVKNQPGVVTVATPGTISVNFGMQEKRNLKDCQECKAIMFVTLTSQGWHWGITKIIIVRKLE